MKTTYESQLCFNSFQTIHINLLLDKLLQTILTNHYKINHSKQFLQTIIIEITVNSAYKLLLESHFRHHLQTITELIPKNAYTIVPEIIQNDAYKLLS